MTSNAIANIYCCGMLRDFDMKHVVRVKQEKLGFIWSSNGDIMRY